MLGQSGKMTLTNGPNTITVAMDNIYELDAEGNQIGNGGPPAGKHSLQTFAPVDFTINDTPRRTGEFGVPADGIDFSTTLVGGAANLLVTTFIFLHNGVIRPTANESWTVAGGTVKFSIQVSSWPFCSGEAGNPCQGDTGAFLEFGMEIKGSADASLPDGEKRFTLATDAASGNNITLELSDEVLLDGQWVTMPTGYPKIEVQGSKQLFKFRMPRFTTSALYDPVISGIGVAPPPVPPPPAPPPPSSPLLSQSPSLPPSASPSRHSTVVRILASGSVEDYSDADKAALRTTIGNAAGVDISAVSIAITSASVVITATIISSGIAAAEAVSSTLAVSLANASTTTVLLRQAVPTITVLAAPTLTTSPLPSPEPNSNSSLGAVVAVAIGGLCLLGCAITCGVARAKVARNGAISGRNGAEPKAHEPRNGDVSWFRRKSPPAADPPAESKPIRARVSNDV